MKVIIDRFEGEYAIVELPDKTMAEVSRKLLPGAKEGDVVEIVIDTAARQEREQRIKKLMDEVFE